MMYFVSNDEEKKAKSKIMNWLEVGAAEWDSAAKAEAVNFIYEGCLTYWREEADKEKYPRLIKYIEMFQITCTDKDGNPLQKVLTFPTSKNGAKDDEQ